MARRRAFTLVELLVVLGVILLLIAMLLPSLSRAFEVARRTNCESNLRQLTAAVLRYADEHDAQFPTCDLLPVQAGLGAPSDPGIIPQLNPYARNRGVFHCPDDPRDGMCTYAINDFLGGNWPSYNYHAGRMTEVHDSSRLFALIEDIDLHPRTKNGSGGFVVEPYPTPVWTDVPAMVHGHGTCLSFLDGHAEYWQWSDRRTWKLAGHLVPSTNNVDLVHLQSVEGLGNAPGF